MGTNCGSVKIFQLKNDACQTSFWRSTWVFSLPEKSRQECLPQSCSMWPNHNLTISVGPAHPLHTSTAFLLIKAFHSLINYTSIVVQPSWSFSSSSRWSPSYGFQPCTPVHLVWSRSLAHLSRPPGFFTNSQILVFVSKLTEAVAVALKPYQPLACSRQVLISFEKSNGENGVMDVVMLRHL